jgi:diguanylate cyclase (GGDEF)-like protein/PAS domain S-box-containing protein
MREGEFRVGRNGAQEPVRILLLEDDAHFAELLRMQLRRLPTLEARLDVVGTLAQAMARVTDERYGLILTDLNLPDSSGLATVEALGRAGQQLVIVLTGFEAPQLRAGALEAGAFDFLSKDQLSAASLERIVRLAAMQASTYRSLRDSESRLRSLLELSSDVYWEQDEELCFTSFTERRTARPGGLGTRALIGKRRWDTRYTNLSPADWKAHIALLEAHRPFHDLELCRIEDGRELWISTSGEPVLDAAGEFRGYRGVATDITARKLAEKALRESEARFRSLTELSSDWYWEQDVELRFVSTGGSSDARGGITPEAHIGKRRWELPNTTIVSHTWEEHKAVCAAHQPFRDVVLRRMDDDGQLRYVGVAGRPVFDARGVFCGYRGTARDITDRVLAEQALRESEARFRDLTALSSDWYWEQDASLRFTVMTGGGGRGRTGLPMQTHLGKTRWDLPALNLSEEDWARHRAQLERREPFHDFEIQRQGADGRVRWASVSGEPVFDAEGRFRGYRGVGKDITARKRDEQMLRLEQRVTRSLSEAEEPAAGVAALMRAVCETENWDCGRFFVWDESAGLLRMRDAWAVPDPVVERFVAESRKLTFLPGRGIAGRVWQGGEPLWSADVASDPRTQAPHLSQETGVRGLFAFPVLSDGGCVGVMSFASRTVREPDERLLRAARVIGSRLGQFLERKRAQSALSESEARARQTFELAASGIAHVGLDGRFLHVNPRLCQILGYSAEELVGRSVKDISHPDDRDVTDAQRARVWAGELQSASFEKRYLRRDGSVVWVSLTVALARDERGEPLYEISVLEDITARKQAESAMHRFRTALDQSADMVLLVDMHDARLLDFNDTACAYLGYERSELMGQPSGAIVAGVSNDELIASHDELLTTDSRADSLVRTYRRKDGTTFDVEVLRRVIDSPDGSILVINARDLTERKRGEARQAAHLRYQERIARFGQSALAQRERADLVEKAVQSVLEALVADAVAYLEPANAAGELTVRELAGALQPESGVSCRPVEPFLHVLHTGNRSLVDGAELPLPWAQGMRSVALVPVRGEGGVRGILCACYARADAFAAEELNFVDAAASVLSTGLQRIDSEARLAYLAQFDSLTGLPNRALLADRFSQMIVRAQRHDRSLGVLFIDLDEFKLVNDTLGHAGGDALLKEISVRLQAAVRPGDTVARISGDEFAVVLADLAQPEDAALVAQKVLDRLAAPVDVHGSEAFVTASVGIAVFPGDGRDAETLIGAADAAMYRAKQAGRNSYQFFTAEITQRTRARAQLGAELRRALEREELALVYQPKFSLETRRPHGAEALLRWRHPERGMVSPAEFIPVLEDTGLIVQAGEWVLRRACEDIKAWRAAGVEVGPVAVNLSARQFRQSDLDARIAALIAAAGVEAAAIELEITESQLMHDPEHAIRVMRALREAGVRMAIDDFGTGYSSLSALTRFPVAMLKIDRSFIADVYRDASAAAIVRTIIEMAHTLGFSVVAEGVETEEQAKFLRLLRCGQAQGYLFARPMPAAELSALISSFASGRAGN